jgi:hypothetical protein
MDEEVYFCLDSIVFLHTNFHLTDKWYILKKTLQTCIRAQHRFKFCSVNMRIHWELIFQGSSFVGGSVGDIKS